MISLITIPKAQKLLAERVRQKRLELNLTQEGLAERAGVSLPTYRRFEQKGLISLESFLKVLMALGALDDIKNILSSESPKFSSIEEVLETKEKPVRKRGRRK